MKEGNTMIGVITQYTETLEFSEQDLVKRVKLYLSKAPNKLYRGDIVSKDTRNKTRIDGYYTSDTHKNFAEIISDVVIEQGLAVAKDLSCTYNSGERLNNIKNLKISHDSFESLLEYSKNESQTSDSETKLIQCLMMQEKIGHYRMCDYQVPTTNGKKENIDLFFKDEQTDKYYMIEAKTFNSNESILRCVLEIETYFRKLNDKFYNKYKIKDTQLKKGVLIDENCFAYKQLQTEWAKKLIKYFHITIFILSMNDKEFVIKEY